MNLLRTLAFIGTLFFCSHASAQVTCNPDGSPSGSWVQSYGSYLIGDVAIFGPGCNQLSDGGIQAATSVTPVSGATLIDSANCGTRFLPNVNTNVNTYAITWPAAGSLPTNCIISVTAPISRGVQLIVPGLYDPTPRILWPNQSITIIALSSSYLVIADPGRYRLPADTEICVSQNGDDTQDGLVTSGGAGCIAHIQTCVDIIYQQWDANDFNPECGLYGGGTATFNEAVSAQGQNTGKNYVMFNARASITWGSTTACFTTGDNGEAIFNALSPFVITWKCNTSNAAAQGALYLHQLGVIDITGEHNWNPGGTNDNFVFIDGEGRVDINGTGSGVIIGAGVFQTANSFVDCDYHCSGATIGGVTAFAGGISLTQFYVIKGGGIISHSSTPGGTATSVGATPITGNSVLRLNGLTLPGGTTTSPGGVNTGGQVCTVTC